MREVPGADGSGQRRARPLRYLSVVDGIVAGEGNGPMAPDPKPCGVILAGTHPVAVDMAAATLIGFDWRKLRLLQNSFALRELNFVPFQPDDVEVVSNRPAWTGRLDHLTHTFNFCPHFGWLGAFGAGAVVVWLMAWSPLRCTSATRGVSSCSLCPRCLSTHQAHDLAQ